MLRGLLVRQIFLAVDVFMAVLIFIVGLGITLRILETDDTLTKLKVAAGSESIERPSYVRTMPDRSVYDGVASTGLFGDAGKVAGQGATEETQKPVEIKETTLPLKLYGTAAAYPTDPLGTAVIENGETRVSDVYYLNQRVLDGVFLKEIHPKEVRLFNEKTNTLEVLRVDESASRLASSSPPGGSAPRQGGRVPFAPRSNPTTVRGNQVNINRAELMNELSQMNPTELYAQISPQLKKDEKGNVIGITSPNIGKIPLAQKYGFRDGDVIQSINGVAIDSEQRVLEVLTRYQNAPTHYVSILRDGKPQTLVFRVE